VNFEDLTNFNSEASVQQWEGEDFRTGVSTVRSMFIESTMTYTVKKKATRKALNFNLLSLCKRARKINYSVDNYFQET
jgi:SWI/SNF-related matrix-associated actin-dependent regulator of chromatin subfamily A member 5